MAYDAQELSVLEGLNRASEHRIVETYLLFHIMPNPRYSMLDATRLNMLLAQAPKFYTGWLDTVMFVQDTRDALQYEQYQQRNPFFGEAATIRNFNSVVGVVGRVGENFGKFQNLECREMKNRLLELSDGSGRVRLSKFYEAAFENRSSHFSESPDYLRHQGVLDETDPRRPSVILTNYVYGRGNCLACSSLYSTCCINECEGLMANLEKSIANPLAEPRTVAQLAASMPSDTVSAPRNLSTVMLRRLDEIAGRHSGLIPLHGRLFAQWMHHAYPNECPYPHTSGSLEAPISPTEWLQAEKKGGHMLKASMEAMRSFVETAAGANSSDILDALGEPHLLPWTEEEELMLPLPSGRSVGGVVAGTRFIVLAMAISSLAAGLIKMLRSPMAQLSAGKARKGAQVVGHDG